MDFLCGPLKMLDKKPLIIIGSPARLEYTIILNSSSIKNYLPSILSSLFIQTYYQKLIHIVYRSSFLVTILKSPYRSHG